MKTLLSLLLPFGFAALMALPFNIEIVGSLLFSVGLLFVMHADYRRRPKLLTSCRTTRGRAESLRLAA